MDPATYRKVKKVMRTLDMGVPLHEKNRAIYDMAVYELGADRVGSFEDYQLKRKGYWTLDLCQAAAQKYSNKKQWSKSIDSASYKAAYSKGWLDQCCTHMIIKKQKPPGYWTINRCKKIALKYSSKMQWKKSVDSASHAAAYSKGWIDQCCEHMSEGRKPIRHWTLEKCKNIAIKYSSRNEWNKFDSASFQAANKKGWLDLCCEHMNVLTNFWTFENCKEIALNYSRRSDWQKSQHRGGYSAAQRNGWLDLCCGHMKAVRKSWTLEACQSDALKYQTRSEWAAASYAYEPARRKGWLNQCCTHMKKSASAKV